MSPVGHPDWLANPRTTLDLVRLTPANPATGQPFSVVVPAGQRWRLISICHLLDTSGGGTPRLVEYRLNAGAADIFRVAAPFNQAAGLIQMYVAGSLLGAAYQSPAPDFITHTPLSEWHMLPGEELIIAAGSMGINDQLRDIVITYERITA